MASRAVSRIDVHRRGVAGRCCSACRSTARAATRRASPSAPSICRLMRADGQVAVAVADHPVLRELRRASALVGARAPSPRAARRACPRRPAVFNSRWSRTREPASWKLVTPFESALLRGELETRRASRALRRSSGARVARASSIRPAAVSRSSPVGSPLRPSAISPPAGFGVVAGDAGQLPSPCALTKLAWPLACVSSTGLSGETRLERRRASGSPRRWATAATSTSPGASRGRGSTRPGFARLRRLRHQRDDLVPVLTFIRLRFSCASPRPVKCAVALDEAGDRAAARGGR